MTADGVTKEEFDNLTGGVDLSGNRIPGGGQVPGREDPEPEAPAPAGVTEVPLIISAKNGATYHGEEFGSWIYVPLGFFIRGRRVFYGEKGEITADEPGDYLVPYGQVEDVWFDLKAFEDRMKSEEIKAA